MSDDYEDKPLAAEDDRNIWIGVAIFLLGGGLFAAAFAVIFMSAAFMDRSSDRAVWQMWLGASAGLTFATAASGILVATIRRRTPRIWLIPAILFVIPLVVVFVMREPREPEPPQLAAPYVDLPLNEVTDAGG